MSEEDTSIVQWAIYERPEDYPEGYVVRKWLVGGGNVQPGAGTKHATLDEARAALPAGVALLPDFPGDDPTIIEVWM